MCSRGHNKELIKLKDVAVDDDRRLIKALCDILEVKLENLINSSDFKPNKRKAKKIKYLFSQKNSDLKIASKSDLNSKPMGGQNRNAHDMVVSENNHESEENLKKSRKLANAKRLEEIRQEVERECQLLKKEGKEMLEEHERLKKRLNMAEPTKTMKKPEEITNKSKPSIIDVLVQLFK